MRRIIKQEVKTPELKDCYCGSKAKVVWMDYDNFQAHCVDNDHRITPEMGSRHRAICRWNNTLDKLKQQNKQMGHDREPIKNTCPDIDNLIEGFREVDKIIKYCDNIDEIETLKDSISNIKDILWNYESELESLRNANDSLRNWGVEEAEKVDKLKDAIESLSDYF